jgi:hypothetical protein
VTPAELLAAARELIARPDALTAGAWPRTAAFLARQALEEAVNARWAADPVTEPMRHATMWSRLTCLPAYTDAGVARQVAFAYAALTRRREPAADESLDLSQGQLKPSGIRRCQPLRQP